MLGIKRWLRKMYVMYLRQDEKEISYYRYMESGGEALRLDYPLKENSVVIDVGGYIGDFAADILEKFNCKIDVFEPVASYADEIRNRFASTDNIEVIQAGLGASEREEVITLEGLGSSVFTDGRKEVGTEKIKIISIVDYINLKDYEEIDLLKINIEGGEFELLNCLLEHPDLIKRIKYFQIQFHDFVPDAKEMRERIQVGLSKTHKKTWDFPFIWENWEIKR